MNIVVLGAGAIGSLFGALLSSKNNVVLIGRKPHVDVINKKGLKIEGITKLKVKIDARESINKIDFSPDLIILAVKSYDTESAVKKASKVICKNTIVLSLQNGIDNIDKIKKYIESEKILVGVTTHGALFLNPGIIRHTGKGSTILGKLSGGKTVQLKDLVELFNKSGIYTISSDNIIGELWIKAIVNSSINPLTAIFQCKNGYLLENPVLERLVEITCLESTDIANTQGYSFFSHEDMIKITKKVIRNTSDNYSSMLQSVKRGKKTEIDSINGKIMDFGKKNRVKSSMNEILTEYIQSLYA